MANTGLTLLDYDEMVKAQDGRCRICGTTDSGIAGEVWAVDHDHLTKRVRALLCSGCNAGLGLFGDSPERLRAAADYLETVEQRLRWRELAPAEKAEYSEEQRMVLGANTYRQFVELLGPSTEAGKLDPLNARMRSLSLTAVSSTLESPSTGRARPSKAVMPSTSSPG